MEGTENIEEAERTNEEYISVLLDNKEDFGYVAEMMMQWTERSSIKFNKDGISSDSEEISDEISNNQENLYNKNETWFLYSVEECLTFNFSKPPKDYHGGWYYWENTDEGGLMKTAVIDENWTLEMLPNV